MPPTMERLACLTKEFKAGIVCQCEAIPAKLGTRQDNAAPKAPHRVQRHGVSGLGLMFGGADALHLDLVNRPAQPALERLFHFLAAHALLDNFN